MASKITIISIKTNNLKALRYAAFKNWAISLNICYESFNINEKKIFGNSHKVSDFMAFEKNFDDNDDEDDYDEPEEEDEDW